MPGTAAVGGGYIPATPGMRSFAPGTAMRGGTAAVGADGTLARPMTSNRGAGFSSSQRGAFCCAPQLAGEQLAVQLDW